MAIQYFEDGTRVTQREVERRLIRGDREALRYWDLKSVRVLSKFSTAEIISVVDMAPESFWVDPVKGNSGQLIRNENGCTAYATPATVLLGEVAFRADTELMRHVLTGIFSRGLLPPSDIGQSADKPAFVQAYLDMCGFDGGLMEAFGSKLSDRYVFSGAGKYTVHMGSGAVVSAVTLAQTLGVDMLYAMEMRLRDDVERLPSYSGITWAKPTTSDCLSCVDYRSPYNNVPSLALMHYDDLVNGIVPQKWRK